MIDPETELQEKAPNAPAAEETSAEAPEATPVEQETASAPETADKPVPYEIESAARRMGWVPRNEWRGPPDLWKPADEFKRRGDEVLPIVKANLRRAEEKTRELEELLTSKDQEYSERLRRLERTSTVALEKQRAQLWNQFEAEKLKAVANQDVDAYKRLADEQREAMANLRVDDEPAKVAEKKTEAPANRLSREEQQVVQDWVDRNTWFNRDRALTVYANERHRELLVEAPGLSLEENLERVVQEIKDTFPKKFGLSEKPVQRHAPPVESGTRQASPPAAKAQSWDAIPVDDRKLAERSQLQYFLPDGVAMEAATAADLSKARSAYAKAYFEG